MKFHFTRSMSGNCQLLSKYFSVGPYQRKRGFESLLRRTGRPFGYLGDIDIVGIFPNCLGAALRGVSVSIELAAI